MSNEVYLQVVNGVPPAAATGKRHRPTVGIIVIGDEILNGHTRDTNSHFMCRLLHQRGVSVKRVSVIGDHVAEIAGEVKKFSLQYDHVFTSGGIGTTHDDRTFEALAAAFDEPLEVCAELRDSVERFLAEREEDCSDPDMRAAVDRFSRVPLSARLLPGSDGEENQSGDGAPFPIVQVHNVVPLPGVPAFCERSFRRVERILFHGVFSRSVYLRESEIHIQRELSRVAKEHEARVMVGCYPAEGNRHFKTRLSVQSESASNGEAAIRELRRTFKDYIVDYAEFARGDEASG